MLNSLLLSISSSIDSLGIGITYGFKKIKISVVGKFILFFISMLINYSSIILGSFIRTMLPSYFTKLISNLIIIFIGIYICFKSLKNNISSSDIDNSKTIDLKESIFLTIVLSLDSFCIGFCGSMSDINLYFFPLFVSFFQLFFLTFGSFIGFKFNKFSCFNQNIWSLISGFILIFYGLIKEFLFL